MVSSGGIGSTVVVGRFRGASPGLTGCLAGGAPVGDAREGITDVPGHDGGATASTWPAGSLEHPRLERVAAKAGGDPPRAQRIRSHQPAGPFGETVEP